MDIIKLTPKFTPEAVLLTGDNLKEVADSEWSAGFIDTGYVSYINQSIHFLVVEDLSFINEVKAYPGQYIIKTAPNRFSVHEPESLNYFYKELSS